jgi:coenzyme F420-reducing hydrogenase delta subunit
MSEPNKKVITLICERAADLDQLLDSKGEVETVPGLYAIKLPCSGMIQPLMIEAALKAGAAGVIVCGCQLGDCYYREGNKMIRERLLGERPPGLKRTVDRRRVMALWLQRLQRHRFLSEAQEFVAYVSKLPVETPQAPQAKAPAKTDAISKSMATQNEPTAVANPTQVQTRESLPMPKVQKTQDTEPKASDSDSTTDDAKQ